MRVFLIIFFLVSIPGYACIPKGYENIGEWNALEKAMESESKNMYFLYGVNGFSFEVPGVSGSPYCWKQQSLTKTIPGTSDAICVGDGEQPGNTEHGRYQINARNFAMKFNQYIFEHVESIRDHNCASS